MKNLIKITFLALLLVACQDSDDGTISGNNGSDNGDGNGDTTGLDLSDYFDIDFDNLPNYANQTIPSYITRDNTTNNPISDEGATLGRILFYDRALSSDNTVSCSTCHQQENAFSDLNAASVGVNGVTGRHSMRLVNTRFADEARFFWDERANSLEEQTTMPIQDHNEMGFSGENGDPGMADLLVKMSNIEYYPHLFEWVYGDNQITEERMQLAMAQFIRSIQSFDSQYDAGRAVVNNDTQPFPNYSNAENAGKQLFMTPPDFDPNGLRIGGGVGCNTCHRAPEFDIDPNSMNNGVIDIINSNDTDLTVTRSPSLRDLVKTNGDSNGAMMHSAISSSLNAVLDHYNNGIVFNAELDPRLTAPGGPGGPTGQNLQLTNEERTNLIAFLETLSGTDMYINTKWSDPFIN